MHPRIIYIIYIICIAKSQAKEHQQMRRSRQSPQGGVLPAGLGRQARGEVDDDGEVDSLGGREGDAQQRGGQHVGPGRVEQVVPLLVEDRQPRHRERQLRQAVKKDLDFERVFLGFTDHIEFFEVRVTLLLWKTGSCATVSISCVTQSKRT